MCQVYRAATVCSCRLQESLNGGYIQPKVLRYVEPFAMLTRVAPFFIVGDLGATLAFYQSKFGFDVLYQGGGNGNGDDYWAIVGRTK